MNKAELISAIAEKADLSKASAGEALTAFCDIITNSLENSDKVVLPGFGTFSIKERSAREGRHPVTGEKMMIKAAKIPSFKAGKTLKDAVN